MAGTVTFIYNHHEKELFNKITDIQKENPNCAAIMVKIKKADGLVAGVINTSSEVIKACVKIIRLFSNISAVPSFFVVLVPDCNYGNNGIFIFADAGIISG